MMGLENEASVKCESGSAVDNQEPKTKLEKLLAQRDIFETLRRVNTG
jgi:hypothetical protein